jgi:hypothetical protein
MAWAQDPEWKFIWDVENEKEQVWEFIWEQPARVRRRMWPNLERLMYNDLDVLGSRFVVPIADTDLWELRAAEVNKRVYSVLFFKYKVEDEPAYVFVRAFSRGRKAGIPSSTVKEAMNAMHKYF